MFFFCSARWTNNALIGSLSLSLSKEHDRMSLFLQRATHLINGNSNFEWPSSTAIRNLEKTTSSVDQHHRQRNLREKIRQWYENTHGQWENVETAFDHFSSCRKIWKAENGYSIWQRRQNEKCHMIKPNKNIHITNYHHKALKEEKESKVKNV